MEEMEALKKAYAEVILNMAKEAAARVMVAEQKALKYQQDLNSSKEEAIQMLLRLKLMIDTKTAEAKSSSQNQQRRIDELEAQLNEAEGLIIDLRAELYNVQEQLKEAKNKNLHHLRPLGKEDLVCHNRNMAKSKLNNSDSFKFPTELVPNLCHSVDMSETTLCNYSKDIHILASGIGEINEPEIYQNGCCEIEISLADERLHSEDDPGFPIKVKHINELSGREVGAGIMPSSKTKKIENLVHEETLKGHGSKHRPYTFHGKKGRKIRYGKKKNGSCKVRCNKPAVSRRPLPAISRSARYLNSGTYKDRNDNPSTNTEKKCVARRSLRKRRLKYLDDGFVASLSHCSHSNQLTRPGQKCPSFSQSKSNGVECSVKSSKLGGEGDIEEDACFLEASSWHTTDNRTCRIFACEDNDANDDKELIDVLVKVDDGDDNLLLNVATIPVESILGDATAFEKSMESTVQGNNKTPAKYTFSRKRKKDPLLNPNENASLERSMKKKSAEIENIDPKLQDLNNSSVKSKQLLQVAHQLISLSGRSLW